MFRIPLKSRKKNSEIAERLPDRFLGCFRKILSQCGALEALTGKSARALACLYMKSVWQRRQNAEWWRENGEYVDQAWFILNYLQENSLIECISHTVPEPVYRLKSGSTESNSAVHLQIDRNTEKPDTGRVSINASFLPDEISRSIRRYGYLYCDGVFSREIDVFAGRIEDRACEIGCFLLEAGFDLCLKDRRVFLKIQAGEYEEEHRYWVLAGETEDLLIIRMPWDSELYSHIVKAGGKWRNRRIEMSVDGYLKFEDVAHICGFRVTEEAEKRICAWREAKKNAYLYKGRKKQTEKAFVSVRDEFQSYLMRERDQLSDLLDVSDE